MARTYKDICPFCRKGFDKGEPTVRLSTGRAHGRCSDDNSRRVTERFNDPDQNRPISEWRTVCGLCRQLVRSIFHITEQGVRCCAACSAKFGVDGAAKVATKEAMLDFKVKQDEARQS